MVKEKNAETKSTVIHQLIPILIIISLLTGGVFLTRAYFLQNPPESGESIGDIVFPTNELLTIESAVTELGSFTDIWGSELSRRPEFPQAEGLWLGVNTGSQLQIGVFNEDGFEPVYLFPNETVDVSIYEGGEYYYVLPQTSAENAKIVAVEDGETTEIYTAERADTQILSTHFDQDTKQFFLSEITAGRMLIKAIRPNGDVISVSEVVDLYRPIILTTAEDTLYYSALSGEDTLCYSLDLITKEVLSLECNLVQVGNTYLNYTIGGDFELEGQGEILETNTRTGTENFILFTEEAEWFDSLLRLENELVFLLSDIKIFEGQVVSVPKEIHVYDLDKEKTIRKESELPDGKVLQVAALEDQIVSIVESDVGVQSIMIELETVEVEDQSEDGEGEASEPEFWGQIDIDGCELNCEFNFLSNDKWQIP